ncbi:MAG: sugar phosphate isomerase/epimerase family protein [Planctomycetota bacterium]|nr:sugar phosphate isomerase/epimerase family protein [Planctomycetota bacterium]
MVARGQEAGFAGVEIRLVERETDLLAVPDLSSAQLPQRRRELSETGFRVCGLASSVAFDSPDATERARQCVTGRAYLDMAAELEADFVRVFGDVVRDELGRDTTIQQVSEGLAVLGEYAATLNLEVIIETHGDFSQSDLVAELLDQVDSTAVGVLWDTHHPWRFYGEPLVTTFERYAGRVRHTHWKDSVRREPADNDANQHHASQQAHNLMSGHRHADYVLFGGGEFPVVECLQLLEKGGYEGWYSYEWEKMWHPELEPPEIAFPLFPGKMRQFHELASSA